jgi:hypothetical protein
MAVEQFANNATTTLNGAINSSVTSLVVTSATGFPTVGNFRLLIDSEIMLVTAVSGTTYTVTRGIEGTEPATHASGSSVAHVLTAGALDAFVHAPTGVTPGSYTNANITVGADGRITAASDGSGGGSGDIDYLMPVMTGATTTVDGLDYSVTETNYIADGGADTYRAWRAVTRGTSNSPASYYHTNSGNSWPHYTTFTLPTAKKFKGVTFRGYSAHPAQFAIEGSTDGTTWVQITPTMVAFNRIPYPYQYSFWFPNQNAVYRYLRFRVDLARDNNLTSVSYFNLLNLDLWGI